VTGTAPTARTRATTCLNGVSGWTVTTGVVMTSLTVWVWVIPIAFSRSAGLCHGQDPAATARAIRPDGR